MYNLILTTNILRILREKKITKAELAEKAGISISFVTELTNDKANPSLRIIEAVAEALETPLPMLLDHCCPVNEKAQRPDSGLIGIISFRITC